MVMCCRSSVRCMLVVAVIRVVVTINTLAVAAMESCRCKMDIH